jgi:DNA-directed RNA polymerase specialized sigma24 family protein
MLDKPPDLASDLEWLLQSGSSSGQELAVTLVQECHVPAYRLAICLLDDPVAAHQALRETLTIALSRANRYKGNTSPLAWVLNITLEICTHGRNRWKSKNTPITRSDQIEGSSNPSPSLQTGGKGIPGAQFRQLGTTQRLIGFFHFILQWEEGEIASQLALDQDRVREGLERLRSIAEEVMNKEGLTSKRVPTGKVDARIAMDLEIHWARPHLTAQEISRLAEEIYEEAQERNARDRRTTLAKEILVIAIATALIVVLITRSPIWVPPFENPGGQGSQQTMSQDQPPTPSAFDFVPTPPPLNADSTLEEIQRRNASAQERWDSLRADVTFSYYGPVGYVGPPLTYQVQIWVQQPDRIRVLSESPEGLTEITSQTLIDRGSIPTLGSLSPWHLVLSLEKLRQPFLSSTPYPIVEQLSSSESTSRVDGTGELIGRRALVIAQTDTNGATMARYWLDAQSGLILRVQRFEPGSFNIRSETRVTSIELDMTFPPDFFSRENDTFPFLDDLGATSGLSPEASGAATLRETLPLNPAPLEFNPATRPLTFQYPPGVEDSRSAAELFAGEFHLVTLPPTDPFSLLCVRSPDGRRIAFANREVASERPGSPLYWIDLSQPGEIHEVELDVDWAHFTFQPDGQHLVAFGAGRPLGTIYVIDTETGGATKLLNLESVRRLGWSTDGAYLGLIGTWESPEFIEQVMILHPRTGEVLDHTPYSGSSRGDEMEQILQPWGLSSLQRMGGLAACTSPPSEVTLSKPQ